MATKKTNRPAANKKRARSKPVAKSAAEQAAHDDTAVHLDGPTVVGIAGSAGALTALQTFFGSLPDNTGMAFVVITHLSPEHESHMASVLQPFTRMAVTQVNGKTAVSPNCVYVIPPSKNIQISDSHLDVTEFDEPRGLRTPIDFFFRSLARSHRDAVAIILSGGGTDGSVGVKDVKEEGGLLMVQDPEEAEYSSMPEAAIATGLADVVLPTKGLAARLLEYSRHLPHVPPDIESLGDQEWAVIQKILVQVQRRTKHDFSQYKRSTILRRIRRRMLLNNYLTLEAYLEHMRSDRAESFALLNDLMIGVTNFFRDQAAWDTLKTHIIPRIFKQKNMAEPLRIWSVGCASGEEAYSLAMLFLEVAAEMDENRTIQIFASDIDEESLARAREGLYPAAIEADVSPERLERFFTRRGDHYQVRRELRDMILFTAHSVSRDPPFSRQDLICCRNLLIYLQHDIQQSVLSIFQYALHPGGYLFLGGSESIAGKETLFQTVDKVHRIYETMPWPAERRHIPALPLAVPLPEPRRALLPRRESASRSSSDPLVLEEQHRRSLEAFGPPSILVTGDYTVLYVSDTAGRYLSQPKGPITSDLLKLAHPDLRSELRAAVFRALEKKGATVSPPIILTLGRELRRVTICVYPRGEATQSGQSAERQALIVFLEEDPVPRPGTPEAAGEQGGGESAESAARSLQLEVEVRRLRDELQTTQEEYDSSAEEMKAANEELQSVNEEYHLTTEELETSKEELEAVNEELQTVNVELKNKLDEISRAHRDLENVLGAMEIATLFLDRNLHIERYTPGLAQFFNILASDVGRPIDHLSHKLGGYDQLTEDARQVLESLNMLDREVEGPNGAWYLIRLRPYRTAEDKIEGVVITFIDITKQRAEAELRRLNVALEERVHARTRDLETMNERLQQTGSMFSTLFHVNPIPTSLTRMQDGAFLDVNEAYASFFGLPRDRIIEHTAMELGLPFEETKRAGLMLRLRREGLVRNLELDITLPSGQSRIVLASLQHLSIDSTEAVVSTFIDITDRVRAERQNRVLAASLTAAEQDERRRISQILHDDLQQRIFAVKMQLTFLQEAYERGSAEGIRAETDNLEKWLTDAIDTTRRLSSDLSPVILQGGTLADSLAWLGEEMHERYGLMVELNAAPNLSRLHEHMRILVFETVRELLFNVVKHADALHVRVTLQSSDDHLQVEVADEGKGFDTEKVLGNPKASHGLLDIRNRLNLLGCSMVIRSQPGEGTRVLIEVPL